MADMTLSEELVWRGFVNQTTFDDLSKLDKNIWTFYHGWDASSDSLTIGNLAAMMLDKCFIRHGNNAIIVAGGATSLIGDPGGKDSERPMQSIDVVESNVAKVQKQMKLLFGNSVTMVNNLDWFKDMYVLTYLRDIGKHFSMTPLIQRDYIATRIGEGGSGISYTELSYTILQGYDFLQLYKKHGANLQLAGADQWGNCLSGVELVRRVTGKTVHALTMPLIVNKATDKKFGKSEAGAVWLDPTKTSVYQFYQFWLNTDDDGVGDYLKIFTELGKNQIAHIMTEFEQNKSERLAQKTLAYEVTKLVHGQKRADSIKRVSEVLFGDRAYDTLDSDDFQLLAADLPVIKSSDGARLDDVLVQAKLASSNSEAHRFLNEGAICINGQQVNANKTTIDKTDALLDSKLIIKRGKNSFALVDV